MNPSVSSSQTPAHSPGRDSPSQVLLCFAADYGNRDDGGNDADGGDGVGVVLRLPPLLRE